ncbi:MAG: ATP-binding cassette domain-containing protein [Hyphomicrobium sp.]
MPSLLRADKLKIAPLPAMSFEVAGGECLSIEGPSGSGKTRLLRALADLDPTDGQVFLDGAERNEMRATKWRRRVRYVATEPAWWCETAREAFRHPAINDAAVALLLESLSLELAILDKPLASLSTGERQRIAFARAIIDQPRVLLLDEPTTGLDAHAASLVEEHIGQHLLMGRTVVLASHDRAQIERLAHLRLQLAPPPPVRLASIAMQGARR